MVIDVLDSLSAALSARQQAGNLRSLRCIEGFDFCSNDYLGLARFPLDIGHAQSGSGGSRLISGHSENIAALESKIAQFHGFKSALLFSSGYAANTGLLSCIAGRGDIILSDTLIHASLIDGIRLTHAQRERFKHNNISDLSDKLKALSKTVTGQIYVVVEALYSMDGDIAPLVEINQICQQYNAALIVDEAHSIGVYGPQGQGLVAEFGLQEQVFAVIYTFGKAVGFHGAAIAGSSILRDYLINFCRPFIYTTAPSPQIIAETKIAYDRLKQADEPRQNLTKVLEYFEKSVKTNLSNSAVWLDSQSPIQGLVIPGNARAKRLETLLRDNGFAVKAILSPTVAKGQERIRFSLHSFNSEVEMNLLAHCLKTFFDAEKS